jgi:hypothetical protein
MYKLFHDLFPEIAERESRSLHIRDVGDEGEIPAGNYLFLEQYCTDPDCDCQRVLLSVTEPRLGIVATISYGFNPSQFPWFVDDLEPFLEPLNPQSQFAEELLAIFKEIVLDKEYDERLKRHYRLVKSAVCSPRASSGRQAGRAKGPRVESARQRRKQQKDARRKNRLR